MESSDFLLEAGRIASKVKAAVCSLVETGTPLIEICDFVEDSIFKEGGMPAFPCNVDINHVAAHYTSPIGDETKVPDGSLVKIDIGVHVEGYIADTAVTLCFDPRLKGLVEAAESALDAAILKVRAGVKASEIGAVIEKTIKRKGFAPIRNLTGHKMARYVLHAGKSIPNVGSSDGYRLQAGEVYAIEPFSTNKGSAGIVRNGPLGHIYLFKKKRKVKGESAKRMLKYIQTEYKTPFASRWILRKFPGPEGREAFAELCRSKCVYSYPQLVEKSTGFIAQAEHTVRVMDDGCIITTV